MDSIQEAPFQPRDVRTVNWEVDCPFAPLPDNDVTHAQDRLDFFLADQSDEKSFSRTDRNETLEVVPAPPCIVPSEMQEFQRSMRELAALHGLDDDGGCQNSEGRRSKLRSVPLRCDFCDKEFRYASILKAHRRIHTGERPFPCRHCAFWFKQEGALRLHVLNAHPDVSLYPCELCGSKFQLIRELKRHMGEVHRVDIPARRNRPSPQPTEGKQKDVGRRKNDHSQKTSPPSRHQTTLSSDGFSCDVCGLSFQTKKQFRAHRRSEHTLKTPIKSGISFSPRRRDPAKYPSGNSDAPEYLQSPSSSETGNMMMSEDSAVGRDVRTASSIQCHSKDVACSTEDLELIIRYLAGELAEGPSSEEGENHVYSKNECHNTFSGHICEDCGQTFALRMSLLRHRNRKHPTSKSLVCKICGSGYQDPWAFRKHLSVHTGMKPFPCKLCDKRFSNTHSLRLHVVIHDVAEKKFVCSTCGSGFRRRESLNLHARKHLRGAEVGGAERYACEFCQKTFRFVSHRNGHLLQEHPEYRPFPCGTCGAAFHLKKRLKKHLKRHEARPDWKARRRAGEVDESTLCPICGLPVNRYRMEIHLRSHTGERPFVCSVCGAGFTVSRSLTIHLRTHTGERPYTCQTCGLTFTSRTNLRRHLRTHSEARPFSCHLCTSTFKQRDHLKDHMSKHTGEKRYACHVCGGKFSSRAGRNYHRKRFHPEEAATLSRLWKLKVPAP